MGLIGLSRTVLVILDQVGQRGDRPPMIERAVPVRGHQEEQAVGAEDAGPFAQRCHRVRQVLDHVGREQHIVAAVGDVSQEGGLGDERTANQSSRQRPGDRPGLLVPERLRRVVHQVERRQGRVQWPEASATKDAARTTDLQPHATRCCVAYCRKIAWVYRAPGASKCTLGPLDVLADVPGRTMPSRDCTGSKRLDVPVHCPCRSPLRRRRPASGHAGERCRSPDDGHQ